MEKRAEKDKTAEDGISKHTYRKKGRGWGKQVEKS